MRRQPGLFTWLALAGALSAPAALAQQPPQKSQPMASEERPWRLEDALEAPDWLKISGSIRPRYESLGNTFYAGRNGGDELLSLQTLVKAEIDTGEIVFGGELLDSRRIASDETGGAPGEIDTLEPAQFYLAWRPDNFLMDGATFDLTIGRFTMDIGGRRLIARSNFRSILQSFDGARATWTSPDKLKLTGFYTAPATRAPSDTPSALYNEVAFNPTLDNVRFGGLHVEIPLSYSLTGEVYAFDFDEDDAPDVATRNRDLSTLGVRLRLAPRTSMFDFDLEYARQTGSVRATASPADITNLDHEADTLHAQAGYTFDAPWSPRLALQYDEASGDKSSADQSSERFDPLFGDRAFELGPTSIFGAVSRTNFHFAGLRLEARPDNRSETYVSLRRIRLDSATDSFANSGVRDATGASGTDVGTQLEVRYRRWLVPDSLRLSVGGATIFQGDFLETAPNATGGGDPIFGYTELTWTF